VSIKAITIEVKGEQNHLGLLTVLEHELGHHPDTDGLTADTLTAGIRLVPATATTGSLLTTRVAIAPAKKR
jgi:hypothetical protein